jgi:hypothetical protein
VELCTLYFGDTCALCPLQKVYFLFILSSYFCCRLLLFDKIICQVEVLPFYLGLCMTCKSKKAKLSRYTPWRHMGERRYSSYSFLTSALDWGEWSASRPGRALPPGKEPPGTHWIGGCVGPRAGLDAGARIKIRPCRGSNLDRPARSQTLYCLSYRGYDQFAYQSA